MGMKNRFSKKNSQYNVHYMSWEDKVRGIKDDLNTLIKSNTIEAEMAKELVDIEDWDIALDLIGRYL
jgi:hypothetical protein